MPSDHYEIMRVERTDDPSLDEAHALASIDDPHVSVAMEIAPERESRPSLIVIERPRGETLEQRGTVSTAGAVHIAIQIAHALHAAHVAGVVHRDVRPRNVMLVRTAVDDAFVKLTGFGKAPRKRRDRFVPPEGNAKKIAGPHTDVFGVGACLDAMLGESRPRDPALARIVARATAADPKERYASAGELEAALRAWSMGERATRRDPAWYALGALVAIGVAMIVSNDHHAPRPIAPPLLAQAHAATAPVSLPGSTPPSVTTAESGQLEMGPPPLDSIWGPMATTSPNADPPPAPSAAVARAAAKAAAKSGAKIAPSYEPPSGTFYVEEPLRYVAAGDGEAWRLATTRKVARCVETVGTGDCAMSSMQLHCTLDRYGVLHCSRLAGWDKSGKACSAPQSLEDCIGRAASGVVPKPKFDRADVQLAEMKHWLRRAR